MNNLDNVGKIWKWLTGFFLLNLVLRLAFLFWHPAVYTDSVYYMTALERIQGTFILPGYPFFLRLLNRLVGDSLVSGRLVSILAGALSVLPLMGIARIVSGKRAAIFSAALYTVSPLVFRWSLRIFPHAQYALFVLLCFYGILKCLPTGNSLFLALGIFSGGLAALTYPTGLVLVPPAAAAAAVFLIAALFRERKVKTALIVFPLALALLAVAFFYLPGLKEMLQPVIDQVLAVFPVKIPGPILLRQYGLAALALMGALLGLFYLFPRKNISPRWWMRPLVLLLMVVSFSAFVFLHVWQKYLAKSNWYGEGMKVSWQSIQTRGMDWLVHYLYSYPWILTYPVALLALAGLLVLIVRARKSSAALSYALLYLYFFAAITFVLVVNKWWTPRYQYELVPAGLILGGVGIDAIYATRKIRWLGIASLVLCLLASSVFTGLVLVYQRDSFADISRLSLYVRDRFPGRSLYTDETLKAGFFAKPRPLRGYTNSTRGNLKVGDLVMLHGWHTNLETEKRYMGRLYDVEIIHKEHADIIPLLADDIVDWAGKRLPRRANAPVVWDERMEPQHFESWLVEIKAVKGKADSPATGGKETAVVSPAFSGDLLTDSVEHAGYFDVGVWEVANGWPEGTELKLEMAHAREGDEGSIRLAVFADADGDGVPDGKVAESPLFAVKNPGDWSSWTFAAPRGRYFVGASWPIGNWIYYERGPWTDKTFGETMFYSRGGIPRNKAYPVITNLRLAPVEKQ